MLAGDAVKPYSLYVEGVFSCSTLEGVLPGITCSSVMRPDLQATQQVSKDVLWEDLLDYDEDEAEEDFLQQYIALLVSNHEIGPCSLLLQVKCIISTSVCSLD